MNPAPEATMHQQIYVNLAVKNMARSLAFFKTLGFSFEDLDGHIWELMHMDQK